MLRKFPVMFTYVIKTQPISNRTLGLYGIYVTQNITVLQ